MNSEADQDLYKIFFNEVSILSWLRHPNIIMYLGHFIEDNYYTVVTEEMNDNISAFLLEEFSIHISSWKMLEMCIEIAKGILYLHSLPEPILHWDLKVENILVNQYN